MTWPNITEDAISPEIKVLPSKTLRQSIGRRAPAPNPLSFRLQHLYFRKYRTADSRNFTLALHLLGAGPSTIPIDVFLYDIAPISIAPGQVRHPSDRHINLAALRGMLLTCCVCGCGFPPATPMMPKPSRRADAPSERPACLSQVIAAARTPCAPRTARSPRLTTPHAASCAAYRRRPF